MIEKILEGFKYIGTQKCNGLPDLELYNCIKEGCDAFGTTISHRSIESHYWKYHAEKIIKLEIDPKYQDKFKVRK